MSEDKLSPLTDKEKGILQESFDKISAVAPQHTKTFLSSVHETQSRQNTELWNPEGYDDIYGENINNQSETDKEQETEI